MKCQAKCQLPPPGTSDERRFLSFGGRLPLSSTSFDLSLHYLIFYHVYYIISVTDYFFLFLLNIIRFLLPTSTKCLLPLFFSFPPSTSNFHSQILPIQFICSIPFCHIIFMFFLCYFSVPFTILPIFLDFR